MEGAEGISQVAECFFGTLKVRDLISATSTEDNLVQSLHLADEWGQQLNPSPCVGQGHCSLPFY